MDPNAGGWDSLAGDLLVKIFAHLADEPDIRRFRSVCRWWRCSTPPLPPGTTAPVLRFPCFNPNPGGVHDSHNSHCTLTESTIYCIQPLHRRGSTAIGASPCWVVRLQFLESGTVSFKNVGPPYPWKEAEARLLPKALDLREFKVRETCKAYCLEFVNQNGECSYDRNIEVAVSSCFSEIGGGFMVMGLKKEGNLLGIWRIGDAGWNFDIGPAREVFHRSCFHSIAYHQGKFYVVDDDGGTSTFDPVSFGIHPQVVRARYILFCDKHLVQAFGDLFLVACNFSGSTYLQNMDLGFEVRKLDEERGRWVEEEDVLKDRLLFVTPDWFALVLAEDLPGYEGNCVHHLSIASGCNHRYYNFLLPNQQGGTGTVRFLCGYPCCSKLFWPPPTWLYKNSSTSPMVFFNKCCILAGDYSVLWNHCSSVAGLCWRLLHKVSSVAVSSRRYLNNVSLNVSLGSAFCYPLWFFCISYFKLFVPCLLEL